MRLPDRRSLFAAAFVAFVALGPLGFLYPGPVQTRATPPWPRWNTEDFLDGKWTAALGKHLEESSPITIEARGLYNEAAWLAGERSFGSTTWSKGGWLYNNGSLRSPSNDPAGPARRAVLGRLANWLDAHGVRLLAVPVPDKWRVHPEGLPEDVEPNAGARARYPTILDELAAAGIEHVDLATAMRGWREADPAVNLFSARDTHWNAAGAIRTADLIATQLATLGWLDDLPPDRLVAEPLTTVSTAPDLVGTLGIREDGPLARELAEEWQLASVHRLTADGVRMQVEKQQPSAGLAVAGDSFSVRLLGAVEAATGRIADGSGTIGAEGPIHGLTSTLRGIGSGQLAARVVVWCFIERSVSHDRAWQGAETPLADGGD